MYVCTPNQVKYTPPPQLIIWKLNPFNLVGSDLRFISTYLLLSTRSSTKTNGLNFHIVNSSIESFDWGRFTWFDCLCVPVGMFDNNLNIMNVRIYMCDA